MEKERVKEVINALYQGAGIEKRYTGKVNDDVAEVLGKMLNELKNCSASLAWVPRPYSIKPSISWIANNFSRSVIDRLRDSQSLTCAKAVIYKWDRKLTMAGMGL